MQVSMRYKLKKLIYRSIYFPVASCFCDVVIKGAMLEKIPFTHQCIQLSSASLHVAFNEKYSKNVKGRQ